MKPTNDSQDRQTPVPTFARQTEGRFRLCRSAAHARARVLSHCSQARRLAHERDRSYSGFRVGDLYLYVLSTWSHFWPLVTAGSLLGIEEFATRYSDTLKSKLEFINGKNKRTLQISAIILAVFISGFLAWKDEHQQLVVALSNNQDESRHISVTQAAAFKAAVANAKELKNLEFFISYSFDNGSYLYADEIYKMCKNAGLKAQMTLPAGQGSSERGLVFYVRDEENLSLEFVQLAKGMDAAKLSYTLSPAADYLKIPNPDFQLFVTKSNYPPS